MVSLFIMADDAEGRESPTFPSSSSKHKISETDHLVLPEEPSSPMAVTSQEVESPTHPCHLVCSSWRVQLEDEMHEIASAFASLDDLTGDSLVDMLAGVSGPPGEMQPQDALYPLREAIARVSDAEEQLRLNTAGTLPEHPAFPTGSTSQVVPENPVQPEAEQDIDPATLSEQEEVTDAHPVIARRVSAPEPAGSWRRQARNTRQHRRSVSALPPRSGAPNELPPRSNSDLDSLSQEQADARWLLTVENGGSTWANGDANRPRARSACLSPRRAGTAAAPVYMCPDRCFSASGAVSEAATIDRNISGAAPCRLPRPVTRRAASISVGSSGVMAELSLGSTTQLIQDLRQQNQILRDQLRAQRTAAEGTLPRNNLPTGAANEAWSGKVSLLKDQHAQELRSLQGRMERNLRCRELTTSVFMPSF